MSTTVQAVATVAASPSPSPLVVHDTVTKVVTVVQASPLLVAGLQVAGLALAGYLASVLHQVFETLSKRPDGWSRGFNVSLQVLVGLVVSAVAGAMSGTLALNQRGILDFLGSFLIVMGSSQTRYIFFKWVESLGTDAVEPDPVIAADEVVPQKATV